MYVVIYILKLEKLLVILLCYRFVILILVALVFYILLLFHRATIDA